MQTHLFLIGLHPMEVSPTNIGEPQREIIIEPIEEPKWIEEPAMPEPQKVPEPRKEPVPV